MPWFPEPQSFRLELMISNMVDTVELGQKEEILVNASLIK